MKHTIIDASQFELEEKVVSIKRVTKVVKGGRNFRFTALVVVGDGNGHVGAGLGKAAEIPEAIRKGKEDAMKKLVSVAINENGSITHDYVGKFGSAEVLLKKAPEGTGVIAGGPGRAAYDWSSELTIYLDPNARKGGLGRRLYEELADRLKKMGILNLYACIGYPQVEDEYLTKNSAEFHAHLGFELVGTFHNCGYKFDRWYDMVWMEKIIGEPHAGQPAVKPYSEVKE